MFKPTFLFLTLVLISSAKETPDNGEGQVALSKGNDKFTAAFLSYLVKNNPGTSVIASPFSVLFPLGQLALYSEGNTYTQLMNLLNLSSKDEIRSTFRALITNIQAQDDVIFKLAAKVFASALYPLTKNFLKDSKDVFDAEAENVDFSDADKAADIINKWVEDNTNNRIKNLVSPDMFDANTRTVLTNAIYFLGNWEKQFNPNNTESKDFNVSSKKTVKVDTMYQQSTVKYAEDANLGQVIELFYKGRNFSLAVVLPKEIDGLSDTVEYLKNKPSALNDVLDSTTNEKVRIWLPKFKVETRSDLKKVLQDSNVTDLFDPSKAKINGILESGESTFVSEGIQKAFIELDETGTEAAAANAFVITTLSLPIPPPKIYEFRANHPFLIFIRLNTTTLFCGVFAK